MEEKSTEILLVAASENQSILFISNTLESVAK